MYTVNNYAKDSIKVTYTVYQNFLVYCISCHFDYREVIGRNADPVEFGMSVYMPYFESCSMYTEYFMLKIQSRSYNKLFSCTVSAVNLIT